MLFTVLGVELADGKSCLGKKLCVKVNEIPIINFIPITKPPFNTFPKILSDPPTLTPSSFPFNSTPLEEH